MDEILMLHGVTGTCPDCRDERLLLPVDDDQLEWCCLDCGAAFVSWRVAPAPTGAQTPSRVA